MKFRDFGKNYGKNFNYLLCSKKTMLKPLIKDIEENHNKQEPILICDWGGGNALLSKYLLNTLPNYNLQFIVVDLDKSKFIDHKKIHFYKADIANFKLEKKANYSFSKDVLHYNKKEKNIKFIQNVYKNTKEKFLLMNPSSNKKKIFILNKIANKLNKWFNIYRKYYTFKEINNLFKNTEWKIENIYKNKMNNFDVKQFYKKRFKLNNKQLKELKDIDYLKLNYLYEYEVLCSKK